MIFSCSSSSVKKKTTTCDDHDACAVPTLSLSSQEKVVCFLFVVVVFSPSNDSLHSSVGIVLNCFSFSHFAFSRLLPLVYNHITKNRTLAARDNRARAIDVSSELLALPSAVRYALVFDAPSLALVRTRSNAREKQIGFVQT